MSTQNTAIIIVAAGRGQRFGGPIPKQWCELGSSRVIDHTLSAFKDFEHIVVVIHPDDHAIANLPKRVIIANGGATRSESVKNGLLALTSINPDVVLIHDAARPIVSTDIISNVMDALTKFDGAAPALPVVDALWLGEDSLIDKAMPRDNMYRAQTPQGFNYRKIIEAYSNLTEGFADDVEVALAAGLKVKIVAGDALNFKLTTPEDMEKAQTHVGGRMDIRLGNGFDVHRFGDGDHVTLCGVDVPFHRGLQGHSDADVGLHAITDAIYGALAQGDIGQHFPPSDPQWKGADSAQFLQHSGQRAKIRGYQIGNIDCTLICELPKIGPHADTMRATVAELLNIRVDQVSVKATTSERLGFTGREEGIAALATVTLIRK